MMFDTDCDQCRFARFDNGQQTGCEMGFLEDFQKSGGITQKHRTYILNGKVCPYMSVSVGDLCDDKIDAFLKGIPPINFVVYHNGNEEDLTLTLNSINAVKYSDRKCFTIITYGSRNKEEILKATQKSKIKIMSCRFVSVLDTDANWLNEAFPSSKNGYLVLVNSGYEVPSLLLENLNTAINKKMKRIVYIDGVDEQQNLRTIMCVFAKYLKLDILCDIKDKILLLAETQKIEEQMTFTWGEINDIVDV